MTYDSEIGIEKTGGREVKVTLIPFIAAYPAIEVDFAASVQNKQWVFNEYNT